MIPRRQHISNVARLLGDYPVVLILGARQVGKTTLARQIANIRKGAVHLFDLESEIDVRRLADPELSLRPLRGLVVLDEVQRLPEIFRTLRVLADRPRTPARFLVLGSAAPEFLRQTSESLAGRVAHYELPGLSLAEVGLTAVDRWRARTKAARAGSVVGQDAAWSRAMNQLWIRGSFPASYTASSHRASYRWRGDFIRTFLQRDVPQLGFGIPAATLDRFWAMLSHYHAQVWNGSELGRAFGVSHHVVRRWLESLAGTYMVRVLKPWHANIKKRQIRAPKIYFRDSGILHHYLGVATRADLDRHPRIGASWEGFVIESAIQALGLEERQCYFWATHGGAEIDLIAQQGAELRGIEVKRASAPTLTPSMRTAMADLGLSRIDVIHAGDHSFPLAPRVQAVSAGRMLSEL